MEKTRKARRELNAIDIQLINNYNLQQAKRIMRGYLSEENSVSTTLKFAKHY